MRVNIGNVDLWTSFGIILLMWAFITGSIILNIASVAILVPCAILHTARILTARKAK